MRGPSVPNGTFGPALLAHEPTPPPDINAHNSPRCGPFGTGGTFAPDVRWGAAGTLHADTCHNRLWRSPWMSCHSAAKGFQRNPADARNSRCRANVAGGSSAFRDARLVCLKMYRAAPIWFRTGFTLTSRPTRRFTSRTTRRESRPRARTSAWACRRPLFHSFTTRYSSADERLRSSAKNRVMALVKAASPTSARPGRSVRK